MFTCCMFNCLTHWEVCRVQLTATGCQTIPSLVHLVPVRTDFLITLWWYMHSTLLLPQCGEHRRTAIKHFAQLVLFFCFGFLMFKVICSFFFSFCRFIHVLFNLVWNCICFVEYLTSFLYPSQYCTWCDQFKIHILMFVCAFKWDFWKETSSC